MTHDKGMIDAFHDMVDQEEAELTRSLGDHARQSGVVEAERLRQMVALDQAVGPLPAEPAEVTVEDVVTPQVGEKYELFEEIGRGSFGRIFRAKHRQLRREVALKVHRDVPSGRQERFLVEARALARVHHPGVVTIHDVQSIGGDMLLELELIRGENLHEVVRRRTLGAREAALVGVELCQALAAIHAEGLIHMDVKPENVMRAEDGRIVLLDFGLVRPGDRLVSEQPTGGTPPFMAPECLRSDGFLGPAADVYSLGVTLYWLVSGHYPHPTEKLQRLRHEMLDKECRPLSDVRPDLPPEFVQVVERAIARAPSDRYSSMGELEQALLAFLASRLSRQRRRRNGVLVGCAAGLALLGWWALPGEDAPMELGFEFGVIEDGAIRPLRDGDPIIGKQYMTLRVELKEPAHLYLFSQDEADPPNRHVLFPVEPGQNPLLAGTHVLPVESDWVFKDSGGRAEHLFLVADGGSVPAADALAERLLALEASEGLELRDIEVKQRSRTDLAAQHRWLDDRYRWLEHQLGQKRGPQVHGLVLNYSGR